MSERILTFDQGNTSAKLGVLCLGEGCRDELIEVVRFEATPSLEEVSAFVEKHNITSAVYCTVGKLDVRFVETLRVLVSDELLILTHRTPLPLKLSYDTVPTLGLDRIAAAVGALQICHGRDLVIVDAGTAVTEDLVTVAPSGEATFEGGRISPGLSMRFKALHNYTARLPLVATDEASPVVGKSTAESIASGVVRGLVNELVGVVKEYTERCDGREPMSVMTGGDAPRLKEMFEVDCIVEPNLTLLGLSGIYKYNQTLKFA